MLAIMTRFAQSISFPSVEKCFLSSCRFPLGDPCEETLNCEEAEMSDIQRGRVFCLLYLSRAALLFYDQSKGWMASSIPFRY